MKLEKNSNGILYKNKIQNNYKNMFSSKINEIESLINDENLEEKQKTLEIQKKNAYYKLEKLDKELQNLENYIGPENEEIESIDINQEEVFKNKINDIRQKNMKIQEQIKMIRDYYNNFLIKYKNKQIEEKKELKDECAKINMNIIANKRVTKMTNEEKIILEKEEEIQKVEQELEKVLKELEKTKSIKYISDIRLKELKIIIKKNNKNQEKPKKITKKKNNKSENKKQNFVDILSNIKLSQNVNLNQNNNINKSTNKISQEIKNEPTINIINRKLPFSISTIDNIINEHSNEYDAPKNLVTKTENIEQKYNNQNKKKKNNINLKINKNVNKVNRSSENKINLNINQSKDNNNNNITNNIIVNNNNYKKQSNKYRNFNINKQNLIEQKNKMNNIISEEKNENQNNNINDNSPLGWLDDNSKGQNMRNDQLNNDNKSNGLSKNYNDNKEEDKKVGGAEELSKKDNIFNDRNLEISGIRGNFNRRRPFANKIKF